jgi:hypothetical protein
MQLKSVLYVHFVNNSIYDCVMIGLQQQICIYNKFRHSLHQDK